MKTKLKVCDRCLCLNCQNKDCREFACSYCNLEIPIKDCEGYKNEK